MTLTKEATQPQVVIIGGGISGLSMAWYLQNADVDLHYTVLEQADRWGGKVITDHIDDFVIEGGADSFISQKPWGLQLAREIGLEDDLLGTNDDRRKVFVVRKSKPIPLPDGVMLIVPTKFMPFALSPLISPLGKLRMGMEMFIRPKRDGEDETLADFIRRRLGAEALDKIAEPLMAGIYNAEAEKQSLLATFPRFRTLEEKYGSITRGMLAARKQRQAASNGKSDSKKPSLFTSLTNGMTQFIDTLVERLDGDLRLNSDVQQIDHHEDGTYTVTLADGEQLQADVVVMTTPSYVAANMVRSFAPQVASDLDAIRFVSTGTISLAFRRDEVEHPLNGFGLVIPRSENRKINAVTWTSTKFNHRAPDDHILLRIFFGGSRTPETFALDDEDLLTAVRRELKELMSITAEPVLHKIYRWHRANPQYDVGHLELMNRIEEHLPAGLYVSGSPYRGIGIPDCVHQSQMNTQRIIENLAVPESV